MSRMILNLETAFHSLNHNLFRSFLSVIGIVVGIAAVSTVLSIGKGNELKISEDLQRIGTNLFWIVPDINRSDLQKSINTNIFSSFTAKRIKRHCSNIHLVSPLASFFSNGTLRGRNYQINVMAVNEDYAKIKSLSLLSGRFISPLDLLKKNRVCVIEEISGALFYKEKDSYLWINGIHFRVIGIVGKKDFLRPNALNVYIPITSAQEDFSASSRIYRLFLKPYSNRFDRPIDQVEKYLISVKKGKKVFRIFTPRDILKKREEMTRTATLVTAGIAMLSLFVGGIGIMNILISSVYERTREIGIRKSVGARKMDILIQVLFESLIISFSGGFIGIILGIFISGIVTAILKIPYSLSLLSLIIPAVFSLSVGLLFGIYPAVKASRLDPIEALRYE